MDWAKGYVADIAFTAGFGPEYAPATLAFAALTVGRSPGNALRPKRILELGFGQGFGLALLAAANPDIAFEGCDFNPEHVASARQLIQGAELSNLVVRESSFEEAAGRSGDADVDIIILRGVFSWIAREAQAAILAIIRRRLLPGGMLFVSYNCMPGMAAAAPIRQLILEVKRRNPNRASDRQLGLALDLLAALKNGSAAYFAHNPRVGAELDSMLKARDRAWLAHEYLDDHWVFFQFSEVAARFAEARLSFLCSTNLLENFDSYTCPPALLPLLSACADPIMRETLRDYAVNKSVRRDIFVRGNAALAPPKHRRALSKLRFALTVSRQNVVFKFAAPLGEATGLDWLFAPIVDLLAERTAGFDELLGLPAFGESRRDVLIECLAQLVSSGQVIVVSAPPPDLEPARRFNRMIVDHARMGRFYGHLAAPSVRTGVAAPDWALLALCALLDGKAEDAAAAARHALSLLKKVGRHVVKDGREIESESEALAFLEGLMQPVLGGTIPIWRRLGVL